MPLLLFWFFNCNFFYFLIVVVFYFEHVLSFFNYFSLESALAVYSQILISLNLNFKFFSFLFFLSINYFFNILNVSFLFFLFFELNNEFSFLNVLAYTKTSAALYNGYMLIHPLLLYTSIIFFFITLFFIRVAIYLRINLNLKNKFLSNHFAVTTCAIFLGCAWAIQELNWGGWWSWDIIELGSLIIFIFLLKILHLYDGALLCLYKNSYAYFWFFFFFWFGARFGFFNSVHSFIDQQDTIILTKKLYFLIIILQNFFFNCSLRVTIFNKITKNIDIFVQLIFFSIVLDSFLSIFSNFIFFINFCLKVTFLAILEIKFIFLNLTLFNVFLLFFFINKKFSKNIYFLHICVCIIISSCLYTTINLNSNVHNSLVLSYNYFFTLIYYLSKEQQNLKMLLLNNSASYINNTDCFYIFVETAQSFLNSIISQIFELELLNVYFYIFYNLSFLIYTYFDFIIITYAIIFLSVHVLKLVKLAL